jgi:uncharacterized membrane protein HdeD (DUF308 family)
MWNTLYLKIDGNDTLVKQFKKNAGIAGFTLMALGLMGIFYPVVMTMTTVLLAASILLFAGIMSAWMTWNTHPSDWAGWLKSLLMVFVAAMMIFKPINGAAALGMLLVIYFFLSAFAELGLALSQRPQTIWWLWLFNGLISLGLGMLFLLNWPLNSVYLVGLFIGISLFFDGVALLSGVKLFDTATKHD